MSALAKSRLILGIVQFERVDPGTADDMRYLQHELAAEDFALVWHVDPQITLEPAHPSLDVAPAAIIAIADDKAPTVADFQAAIRCPGNLDDECRDWPRRRPPADSISRQAG